MATFYIDGETCTETNANISVMDHGLLYGDGIFEGLRFYACNIFRLQAHLQRLTDSATAIGLTLPRPVSTLTEDLYSAIKASGLNDGYIRLLVTRGIGALGINPSSCSNPKTIIIVDTLQIVSDTAKTNGAKVIIASTRRLAADQLDPRIKSLNYLNQIMAKQEAIAANADEAIILNQAGFVAEGSADNIFIVKDKKLFTPPTSDGALAGITRAAILEIAATLQIPAAEQSLAPFDLFTADECFLTGTGAELIPVSMVAGRSLPTARPTFNKLQTAFHDLVHKPSLK